jgi:hypothetical protein
MLINIPLEVVPFDVPKVVYIRQEPGKREDGFKPPQSIPLHILDNHTLATMCGQLVDAIFKEAKKQQPPSIG